MNFFINAYSTLSVVLFLKFTRISDKHIYFLIYIYFFRFRLRPFLGFFQIAIFSVVVQLFFLPLRMILIFYTINLIGLFSRLSGFYWFSVKKIFYGNCLKIVVKFF